MSTPATGSYAQLVSKCHREELWRTGKELSQHIPPSATLPCRSAPLLSMIPTEEFRPLLASLQLVLYLTLDLKEQLTAMNVYTQNTGDTVHMREEKCSRNGGSKVSFPQEITQAFPVHCPKPLWGSQATSNGLHLPTWPGTTLCWAAYSSPARRAALPGRCLVSCGAEQPWSSTVQPSLCRDGAHGTAPRGSAQGIPTSRRSSSGNWAKQGKK